MGSFLSLGAQHLEDVAKHVQSFAPAAFAALPPTLSGNPMPAQSVAELSVRGGAVYESAKCGECHGRTGRGDGASAATLKDDEDHPSIPTDLTKRWLFKAGGGTTDVFRTLIAGFNGTPMGSFEDKLSTEDRWALSAYVERMTRPRPRYAPNVQALLVDEKIPRDPAAPFWKTFLPALVPLGPQVEVPPYWTQPSVDSVEIVVAVSADQIGILLTWDDPGRDVQNDDTAAASVAAAVARRGTWRFPDAIAMQFPVKVDPKGTLPPFYLGDATHPVRRWLWSADRQEHGQTEAVIEQFAGPQSAPIPSSEPVPVQTASTWADGQWRVVWLAKRPSKSDSSVPFALQAWNGAAGETGHWQSVSGWMNIRLP
jgi:DMSO reductase family type II enzyme heme b subunit